MGRPNLSHETKSSGVNGNKEIFPCSAADHGQDWQAYPQLPPVIGAPRVCCGHASGIFFPRLLWFGGCATHATQCSVPGYSYFAMCSEKSKHNCLISYWYSRVKKKILYRHKTCPYSTAVEPSSTDILYFEHTLYRSGCGKIYGRRREHREQSRE